MAHRTDMLLSLGAPFEARYGHFIGGDFTAPADAAYRPVLSPVNGEEICTIAVTGPDDRALALKAAEAALPGWQTLAPAQRADILRQAADRLDDDLELLAMAESWDSGKPIRDLMADELPLAINRLRDCAQAAELLPVSGKSVPAPLVVTGSSAFPLLSIVWQAAPALAAGFTLVVETPPDAPASAMMLAESLAAILPAGTVNIIGANSRAAALQRAPALNIYLSDIANDNALLDRAVDSLAAFAFNRGDVAVGPSQALIEPAVYDMLMERLIDRLAGLVPSNPLNPTTRIGAQLTPGDVENVRARNAEALSSGGTLVAGGTNEIAIPAALSSGYYVAPTVIHSEMPGPLSAPAPCLTVSTFTDADDALAVAATSVAGGPVGLWTGETGTGDLVSLYTGYNNFRINHLPAHPSHTALGLGGNRPGAGLDGQLEGTNPDTDILALIESRRSIGM